MMVNHMSPRREDNLPSVVYTSPVSSPKRSSSNRRIVAQEAPTTIPLKSPRSNDRSKDDASTVSTSPSSTSGSASEGRGEEEQSLSSSNSRARQRTSLKVSPSRQSSANVRPLIESFEATSAENSARSKSTRRRSSAHISSRTSNGSMPVDPEYQARRNRRLQAIRSRRNENKNVDEKEEEQEQPAEEPTNTIHNPIEKESSVAMEETPLVEEDKKIIGGASPLPAVKHEEPTAAPVTPPSDATVSTEASECSKLQELRACKTKRESQLRNLMKDCSGHMAEMVTPSSNSSIASSMEQKSTSNHSSLTQGSDHSQSRNRQVALIEPVVYDDMREELMRAYEIIEIQKKQLKQQNEVQSSCASKESDNDLVADLQRQLLELQRERASSELSLLHRMSNESMEYKKTIEHWKREANLWKDRFDSSWDDHEAIIARLKNEKEKWRQRAREAEQDMASFKKGTADTMLELVRAKERIHILEEKLERPREGEPLMLNPGDSSPQALACTSASTPVPFKEESSSPPASESLGKQKNQESPTIVPDDHTSQGNTPTTLNRPRFGRFTGWGK